MAPSWLPSQATVAWWSGFTWCPALSWVFSFYDSHLSIIGHSSSASKLSWLYLHNFPTSAPWTQKLFLVLGPSLSFDFLSSRKFFLKLIFFSWFPLPFSFFSPTALFWDWVLGGTTQLHPNRDQELMFFLSQETLSILCKLTTSSSPRTSFTEQNTPVFSGSGGLWLMKSESFLF